jgi:hypothetical protein
MPTVADYSAILDSNFTLSIGGDTHQDFQFLLPADAPRYPGILAFRTYPNASGTNLFFVVELNGINVFQATLASDGTSFRTVHEVIEPKTPSILKGGSNTINFKLTGGSGAVVFSDLVLWWKRDV